jgi:uncharacterized protein (DUF1330 family)
MVLKKAPFFYNYHASEHLHRKEGIMVYFVAETYIDSQKGRGEYDDYIRSVRPIVEKYKGRYLVRTEKIQPLTGKWKPERFIIIEWDTREQLESCFQSEEYRKIAVKRENSVDSRAIIMEG